MLRPLAIVAGVGLVIGGVYVASQYTVEQVDSGYLIRPRGEPQTKATAPQEAEAPPVRRREKQSIRIGSFHLDHFDAQKLQRLESGNFLPELLSRFDVIALQDIYAPDQGIMLELIEQLNTSGRHYVYALPEHVGRKTARHYNAFVFDRASIEVDPSTVFEVEDPEGHFWRPPLVATFRVRGPEPDEAFTFTLINVHINPNDAVAELDLLDDAFRAIRDAAPAEDDFVLLGSFAADDHYVEQSLRHADATCLITGVPTTTRGTHLADNLVIHRAATTEYTGRAGVVDLMRAFDLSMQEASEISAHLPVWAEFALWEGNRAGPVAARPSRIPR
jgi:hypothetical protein